MLKSITAGDSPLKPYGFISQEIRSNGKRIAFELVDLVSGKTCELASLSDGAASNGPTVGRYKVSCSATTPCAPTIRPIIER